MQIFIFKGYKTIKKRCSFSSKKLSLILSVLQNCTYFLWPHDRSKFADLPAWAPAWRYSTKCLHFDTRCLVQCPLFATTSNGKVDLSCGWQLTIIIRRTRSNYHHLSIKYNYKVLSKARTHTHTHTHTRTHTLYYIIYNNIGPPSLSCSIVL